MASYQNIAGGVLIVTNAGAPTNGTSGTGANVAATGSLLIDTTNANLYQNTNTKASPTWTQFSDLSGALAFTDLDAGASGTAGSIDVFPTTVTSGKIAITATDNTGDYTVGITNAAHGQASAYSIPDSGAAAANFVVTTGANTCKVATGAADRTVTLGGNLTTTGTVSMGTVTLGGTLTTAAAVTFSGANACTFAVPAGGSTWTLPTGGGTLALTTGSETGTTANYFTVDNDCTTGQLKLLTTTGGTNHTVTVTNSTTTGDITVTLPDIAGTLASLAGTQTFTGNKTMTGTLDLRGNVSSGGSNPNIDFSGSSGTTKTTTGVVTIGNVTGAWTVTNGAWAVSAGNPAFDASASNGAFTTSSGANTLSGNTTVAGTKTFTTGTGAVTIKGATTFDAGLDIAFAGAGDGTFDLSTQTGIFKTSTGAVTIGGDTTISGSKTFSTGTGTVTINGTVSVAANINAACVAGTSAFDWSLGTGVFHTSTGACNLNSASGVTINGATTPSVTTAASKTNSGFFQTNGKTSGAIKILPIDAGTGTTTVTNQASAAATITLPAATCTLPGLGLANSFTAAQTVAIDDASNNAVTDLLTLTHTTSGASTAGIGAGLAFQIEDAGVGGAAEQASIDAVMATVTDGAEDCDLVFKTALNGTVTQALKIDSVNQTLVVGANASDADGISKITIYPDTTASRGSLVLSARPHASADRATTIQTATDAAGAVTLTLPNVTGTIACSTVAAFTGNAITGVAVTKIVPFIENATNTLHTGTVPIPAGAMILSIKVVNTVLWGATSAALDVGDDDDANGYFAAVDCKATDLLVGEVLDTADDGCWGGKNGAYLTAAGRRGGVGASNSGPYYGAANNIIGVMTVGTPAATTGRTFMSVTYCVPESIAAVATGP